MPAPSPFPPPLQWMLLALAGGTGTLARALLSDVAARHFGPGFPWGTATVNVVGALLFGWIVATVRSRADLPEGLETLLLVGLLGGFTTFSSYVFQAVDLWQQGRHAAAVLYVVGSNAAGLLAVWAGLRLAA